MYLFLSLSHTEESEGAIEAGGEYLVADNKPNWIDTAGPL